MVAHRVGRPKMPPVDGIECAAKKPDVFEKASLADRNVTFD